MPCNPEQNDMEYHPSEDQEARDSAESAHERIDKLESEILPQMEGRVTRLTQMLCGLCNRLEEEGREDLIAEDPGLALWWEGHKEHDRQEGRR